MNWLFCAIILSFIMDNKSFETEFWLYARSFETGDREIDTNLRLKQEHTLRVVREALALGRAEHFAPRELELLFYTAYLHDLSRFEQFVRFQTFNDLVSFDHGDRSRELVCELDILPRTFSSREKQFILTGVGYHNKREIPKDLEGVERKLLLAVRDADKMDILNILINHLKNPENSAIVYKLPKEAGLSADVAAAIMDGRSPDNGALKSSLDFLAAKFAWGYDLNFSWSCREFLRRQYMENLRKGLPEKPEILDIFLEKVLLHMQKKGELR